MLSYSILANIILILALTILMRLTYGFIQATKDELKKMQNIIQNLNSEANHAREMVLKVNAAIHLIRRIDLEKYKDDYRHKDDDKIYNENTVEIIREPVEIESEPIGSTRCFLESQVDWTSMFKDQSDMLTYLPYEDD